MKKVESGRIVLPALRGVMGNRIYYSCLMSFDELAHRVNYAAEVHQHQALSDMIQRELENRRRNQIAEYLRGQQERFFNSLVVATYGGDPNWSPLFNVRDVTEENSLGDLADETVESVGFLTLDGDERLFAVDGQHRLAGIKEVIRGEANEKFHDVVSVLFVAHEETKVGLERTRRLFTTLNKTARPVSKGEIIALDEDDVMAICVRRLVETTDLFNREKVAFVAGNNMPAANYRSLTTIGNLYDLLLILFTGANTTLKQSRPVLQRRRPSDEVLDDYYSLALKFFGQMNDHFEELQQFFESEDTVPIVERYRGCNGGSALFRPIGLDIFTRVISQLTQPRGRRLELSAAIKTAAKLPRTLSKVPYDGLMWESSTRTVTNAHKVTLREILLYMVGASKFTEEELRTRYRRETGNQTAELPIPVI